MGLFTEFKDKLKDVGEGLKSVIRGMQGLPPDDDVFSGMIDVKDIRERTRLDVHGIYAHTYMRLLARKGGDEWEIMDGLAEHEDKYFISLDGLQRLEAIQLKQAKTEISVAPLQIPGQAPGGKDQGKGDKQPEKGK